MRNQYHINCKENHPWASSDAPILWRGFSFKCFGQKENILWIRTIKSDFDKNSDFWLKIYVIIRFLTIFLQFLSNIYRCYVNFDKFWLNLVQKLRLFRRSHYKSTVWHTYNIIKKIIHVTSQYQKKNRTFRMILPYAVIHWPG